MAILLAVRSHRRRAVQPRRKWDAAVDTLRLRPVANLTAISGISPLGVWALFSAAKGRRAASGVLPCAVGSRLADGRRRPTGTLRAAGPSSLAQAEQNPRRTADAGPDARLTGDRPGARDHPSPSHGPRPGKAASEPKQNPKFGPSVGDPTPDSRGGGPTLGAGARLRRPESDLQPAPPGRALGPGSDSDSPGPGDFGPFNLSCCAEPGQPASGRRGCIRTEHATERAAPGPAPAPPASSFKV